MPMCERPSQGSWKSKDSFLLGGGHGFQGLALPLLIMLCVT
jgi:hypothetical protein